MRACSAGGAEPGGDQEGTELVAVQGGGVRLVVQPGTADVRGRECSRSSSSTAYLYPAMVHSLWVTVARACRVLPVPGRTSRCRPGGRRTAAATGRGTNW